MISRFVRIAGLVVLSSALVLLVRRLAQEHGLARTVPGGVLVDHAGVYDQVTGVLLGATRIGHGTRLAQDDESLAWAADERICIEVCPTSNYLTGAVRPGDEHPVRKFLAAGCGVVLGDDCETGAASWAA